MFVIEIDVDQTKPGPLHGELLHLVTELLAERSPGYVIKAHVSWQDKPVTCPLCGSEAYLCTDAHTDGSGAQIHCRAASLHNFPVPVTTHQKDS